MTHHDEYSVTVMSAGTLEVLRVSYADIDGTDFKKNWRTTLAPGDDLSGQPEVVTKIANAVWTPEVVAAYKASLPVKP